MNITKGTSPFLFGVGTAAHQVEGGNVNSDWWAFEHSPHHPAEPSGDAIDHYHRFDDDIRLIAQLGFNCYRFSNEWARIEPVRGFFSRAAIDHYRRMLARCHEHSLTPVVTFHHFSSPRWIADAGGWENPETARRFAEYCDRAAAHLGDLIPHACTLNEINMPALIDLDRGLSDFAQQRPAGAPFPFCRSDLSDDVTLEAHRLGSAAIKGRSSSTRTGFTLHMHGFRTRGAAEDALQRARDRVEDRFLRGARGDDFIGVQVYGNKYIGPDGPEPFMVDGAARPRDSSPSAVAPAIRHAAEVSGAPIFVTENGYAVDDHGERRIQIEAALAGVRECVDDGVPVVGYVYWSALDIYEWMRGFDDAYGLIAVDRTTQRRRVTETAEWLGGVAARWAEGKFG